MKEARLTASFDGRDGPQVVAAGLNNQWRRRESNPQPVIGVELRQTEVMELNGQRPIHLGIVLDVLLTRIHDIRRRIFLPEHA